MQNGVETTTNKTSQCIATRAYYSMQYYVFALGCIYITLQSHQRERQVL